jgi:predicted nicotinamide N-methyase
MLGVVSADSVEAFGDTVEDDIAVGRYRFRVLRPADSEALLDEEAFDREEFLPYWAELWPSSLALAEVVAAQEWHGRRVVELGCGLALPSLVAAAAGAEVTATDWAPDAVRFAAENARRNRLALTLLRVDWSAAEELVLRAPFDVALASDVLYEGRNGELLLSLLPRLTREVLLADPGRPHAARFVAAAERDWDADEVAPRVLRLRARSGA